MMRCHDVADLASDYINGDLPWRKRLAVRLHLFMCEVCQRYVTQLRKVVELVGGLGLDAASPDAEQTRQLFRSAGRPPD
jgi:anti-sigma factor RsiW